MGRHDWRDEALCKDWPDQNDFFDNFENDEEPFDIRNKVTNTCLQCPVRRQCLMIPQIKDPYGYKISGVYAGLYYQPGEKDHDETINEHVDMQRWLERMLND